MRAAADMLWSKSEAIRGRTRNEKQIKRDLLILADRLNGTALSLVAEANAGVARTTRWAAMLALASVVALQRLAAGAGHVLRLSNFLGRDHGLTAPDELLDHVLIDGARRFAESVQAEREQAIERSWTSGVESDIA